MRDQRSQGEGDPRDEGPNDVPDNAPKNASPKNAPLPNALEGVTESDPLAPLRGRTVVLCLTGSIAAYKAVELARLFVKAGAKVLPVMTPAATQFVGPVTLAGICGEPVSTNMWDASFAGEMHVKLADTADLVAIVPATADVLARLAQGRASDLVTAVALSARGPVLAAPAMHPRMWAHPATQQNVAVLASHGRLRLVGPVRGEVASGDEGIGRMAEPAAIAAAAADLLRLRTGIADAVGPAAADLAGVRVVVTAGPTLEDIDPVRFLGNRSSGKMGFALAARAAARGADVTLIAGPVALETPAGVKRVDVRGALSMRSALSSALLPDLSGADVLIMAAAVADHRPAVVSTTKLKKSDATAASTIELVKNPDLVGEIGKARSARRPSVDGAGGGPTSALVTDRASALTKKRPVLVAFAVETAGDAPDALVALVAYGRKKLEEKEVDLVVCNDAAESFGKDDNTIALVRAAAPAVFLPRASKTVLADAILGQVRALL
jgi:phosphopantothenoylcysteine decarboxylase/phosphopantothenate--cysteine ligase